MKLLSKYWLPVLIVVSALTVSASAAFYSVYGLSKLFAGASLAVILMASALEGAKLVIATLLHNYWSKLNFLLKSYLSLAVLVLIVITSMGIYGFLSAAYQETANQLNVIERQVDFLKQKELFYQQDVDRFDRELELISSNINSLSNARATQIQVSDTSVTGGIRNTVSTAELRLAQNRLAIEEENRREVQESRTTAADSLQKIQLAILDLENNPELAAELGPLKYVSGVTGVPMDQIVNYLLLIIIFVFDPLAVSLVLAANSAFKIARGTNKKSLVDPNEDGSWDPEVDWTWKQDPYITQEDVDKFEQGVEKHLKEKEDRKIVDDEPIEDDPEEEAFNEEYTGEEVKVKKVLQKSPGSRHVLLENGKRVKVNKKDFDERSMTIRYL